MHWTQVVCGLSPVSTVDGDVKLQQCYPRDAPIPYAVGVPHLISKFDRLETSDSIRVVTEDDYVVEGSIERLDILLDPNGPRDLEVFAQVNIDVETADELGAVWCHVTLSARRGEDGWNDLTINYPDEVDADTLDTLSSETLGVVEAVERID